MACRCAPVTAHFTGLPSSRPGALSRLAARQGNRRHGPVSRPHRRSSAASSARYFQTCAAAAIDAAVGTSAFQELSAGTERKYIMVSGKGGVGKTSLAASLAVRFAQEGHATLVVSTDPAHSLGDSLAQDISGGMPVLVEGTALPLWGMEIDPEREKAKFKAWSAGSGKKEAESFMGGFGMGKVVEQLADLKLGELLDSPPPGFDEAVAISKVLQFVKGEEYARFTRIVFDTAPTGHTLRLLTVPDFVDASLDKIIRLRKKLGGASQAIRGLFGVEASQDEAVVKLEQLKASVGLVRDLFRDKEATEFIIATIPTVLGVNESARLIRALRKEDIPCKRIVVNQLIGPDMGAKYLDMRVRDQQKALELIDGDADLLDLRHLRAPYLDLEVRGVPALRYFGRTLWGDVLPELAAGQDRKYFMLGGKGGVGKTSCSSSLAVSLAEEGHTTLVVSTDPAHSLSDSLDQDVSSGLPVEVDGTDGLVFGMEIDLEQARKELRDLSGQDEGKRLDDILGSVGLGGWSDQLKDLRLGELLDTPPPGVDEAIAIAKVIQFLKNPEYARFTRIVFDTAPTGHTLRLLALPDFLDTGVGKILRLRQKLMSVKDSVTGLFGGGKDASSDKFDAFKGYMADARDVFRNPTTTEFVIVTIPTAMAAAESIRLAKALRKEQVPIRTLVVNQVLQPNLKDKYLATRRADQQRSMERLRADSELGQLQVIEAPLFDLEVRGVPALTYFGEKVWQ
ncbi:hypothetical protein D9Q98_005834 [Chlorella vulgaris]|uniref:ArsA/GET3 Anion-transporting ATPase-like domain-containing protein n=1 Tax=Chlorella vulgaris TaxID=3077 RepID=A0A9D4TXL2_CHLVU|nr:hypothetical protein D9Q98_005834 [Chlorella vulgaris]